MKLSTREDIEVPEAFVYDRISDFAAFERQAMRRGAEVNRIDQGPYREGSAWDVAFKFRGRDREMRATLSRLVPGQVIAARTVSAGIDGVSMVELVPLSPGRTRMVVSIEMSAKTIPARLLLQTFKLAKATLTGRLKRRVSEFAEETEDRFKRRS